jgi:hypothetical protein
MNIKTDGNNFTSEQMVTVNSKHKEEDFFSLVPRACCTEKHFLFVSRQDAECLYRVSLISKQHKTAYQKSFVGSV